MNNHQTDNLKQIITDKISSGQIKMRSKTFFAAHRALSWLSGLLFSLFLILTTSFIIYILRYNSLVFKGAGWSGWLIFLNSLPIIFLIIVSLLGLGLSLAAWQQTAAYKKPAVYTVGLITIISLTAALLVNLTPLHARLAEKAFNKKLPVLGSLYSQNLNGRWSGATFGTLTDMKGNLWEMEDSLEKTWQIQINRSTRFPLDKNFDLGDKIIVRGPITQETIVAQAIRKIQDEEKTAFPHMKKGIGRNKQFKNQSDWPIRPQP